VEICGNAQDAAGYMTSNVVNRRKFKDGPTRSRPMQVEVRMASTMLLISCLFVRYLTAFFPVTWEKTPWMSRE
jgi:hypothetical protein